MPRKPKHDDLSHLDLRKRAAPIGRDEKIHQRMERELTNLKRDRRFWEGDKVYRAYVQRQFERVYNDPTGKPQPLRIGAPKIFATEIEPFERVAEPRTSQTASHPKQTGPQASGSAVGKADSIKPINAGLRETIKRDARHGVLKTADTALPSLSQATRSVGKRAKKADEPGLLGKVVDFDEILSAGEGADLEKARVRAPMLLEKFGEYNWDTAERLLSHYLDGSGEPVTISPEILLDYPTLNEAYRDVLQYFSEWTMGERQDSRAGIPILPLIDGEEVTIGVPIDQIHGDLNEFVMWESSFPGVGNGGNSGDLWALGTEAHAAVGGGTLQGFAVSLTLVRDGNRIKISGQIQFRVKDTYDFARNDMFGLHALEEEGSARFFSVLSETWPLDVSGFIVLDDDQPVSAVVRLSDRPFIRGVAGNQSYNPRIRRNVP